jgi:hypothetical protein
VLPDVFLVPLSERIKMPLLARHALAQDFCVVIADIDESPLQLAANDSRSSLLSNMGDF